MDEGADRKRFHIFAALRLSGLAIFFLGVAIAFGDLVRDGGLPIAGIPIAVIGLAETVLAPKLLKRVTRV